MKGDSLSEIRLFESLTPAPSKDVSIEVYDRAARLVGWAGHRGPSPVPDQLAARESSFVQDGPLYSYLTISIPLYQGGSPDGFVVGQRLFDVNYPINNRFINNDAFTSTFPRRLEVRPEFDFSRSAPAARDEHTFSIPLTGISGTRLGFAYLPRPVLATRLDEIHEEALGALNLFLLAMITIIAAFLYRWKWPGKGALLLIRSALLWILRFVLIWLNVPSGYARLEIFNPIYFASPFGSGLAKSVGDLLITSVFLFWNVLLVISWIRDLSVRSREEESRSPVRARVLLLGLLPVLAFVDCLFIRGFAALTRSALFDSNLGYNDPGFIIPSIHLAAMLTGLLVAALSLVLAGSVIVSIAVRISARALTGRDSAHWAVVIIVFTGVSVLFGALQDNPLMGQGERFVYLLGLAAIAWVMRGRSGLPPFSMSAPRLALAGSAAVLGLVVQLDRDAHALDRNHVELLASEISRPVNSWLTLVTNQALDGLSGREAAAILASGDSDDIGKMAFTRWAGSNLSREGYNCNVTYFGPDGRVLSNFHIGTPPHTLSPRSGGAAWTGRAVHIEEKSADGTVVRWYEGTAPVLSDSGWQLGGVRVEVSAGKQAMLRGEAPEFLRSATRETFGRPYRTLMMSEYFGGKLVSTTGESLPLDRPMPEAVRAGTEAGIWLDEEIEGVSYETYYLREQPAGQTDAWVALSIEGLGFRWHLYSYLRYLLFFGLLGAGALFVLFAGRFLRGPRMQASFRAKLLAAFVIVSLIPVGILAYYNREYASERMRENSVKWLSNQTSVVIAEIQRQLGISLPVVLSQLSDDKCSDIAADLNTDFVVYRGTSLQASSKPEMFAAELLEPSLSAEAYLNIVLKKKNFHAENRMIGNLPYVVGYRPIVSENGSVIGVASVPTLYRQTEMNAELTRRDVFLYGAYAVALLFSLVVGTAFAGQISSPIRRLKSAALEVARGNLDVKIERHSRDELGDLEQSFGEMVRDLRRAQEETIRAQRELAWREMAKQIAHEIKNPLTPMKLSIQHLRQAYRDGAKEFGVLLRSISETLLVQIDTLSTIATEFSIFARMPERKLETCDVHGILAEARHLYEQDGKIAFRSDLAPGKLLVSADPDELRRVFINILRNSVQAMEGRGVISLSTKRTGNDALVGIADDGPGVPPAIRGRLFEPNFSTKTEGMGLGLAIVKKIIDDLGGSIAIESPPAGGTEVSIRLPLAGRETAAGGADHDS